MSVGTIPSTRIIFSAEDRKADKITLLERKSTAAVQEFNTALLAVGYSFKKSDLNKTEIFTNRQLLSEYKGKIDVLNQEVDAELKSILSNTNRERFTACNLEYVVNISIVVLAILNNIIKTTDISSTSALGWGAISLQAVAQIFSKQEDGLNVKELSQEKIETRLQEVKAKLSVVDRANITINLFTFLEQLKNQKEKNSFSIEEKLDDSCIGSLDKIVALKETHNITDLVRVWNSSYHKVDTAIETIDKVMKKNIQECEIVNFDSINVLLKNGIKELTVLRVRAQEMFIEKQKSTCYPSGMNFLVLSMLETIITVVTAVSFVIFNLQAQKNLPVIWITGMMIFLGPVFSKLNKIGAREAIMLEIDLRALREIEEAAYFIDGIETVMNTLEEIENTQKSLSEEEFKEAITECQKLDPFKGLRFSRRTAISTHQLASNILQEEDPPYLPPKKSSNPCRRSFWQGFPCCHTGIYPYYVRMSSRSSAQFTTSNPNEENEKENEIDQIYHTEKSARFDIDLTGYRNEPKDPDQKSDESYLESFDFVYIAPDNKTPSDPLKFPLYRDDSLQARRAMTAEQIFALGPPTGDELV
jgi:hypothetical protein